MKSYSVNYDGEKIPVIEKGQGDTKICLLSLCHGQEVSGLQVNRKVIEKFNLGDKAKLFSFPVMNPQGFKKQKLEHPQYGDINRNPLSKVINSQSIQYLRGIFEDYLSKSDLVIDLHSWTEEKSLPGIFLTKIDSNQFKEKSKAIKIKNQLLGSVRNSSLPIIEDSLNQRNYLSEEIQNKGKTPNIFIELGKHYYKDKKEIENLSNNVIEIIEEFIENKHNQVNYDISKLNYYKSIYMSAPINGELIPLSKPGKTVKPDQNIFKVRLENKSEIACSPPVEGKVLAYDIKGCRAEVKSKGCVLLKKLNSENLIY